MLRSNAYCPLASHHVFTVDVGVEQNRGRRWSVAHHAKRRVDKLDEVPARLTNESHWTICTQADFLCIRH